MDKTTETAKPTADETLRDLKEICGYLDLVLDNLYDSTGSVDEGADQFLHEIKAKYGF